MARQRYPKRRRASRKIVSYKDSSTESEFDSEPELEDLALEETQASKRIRHTVSRANVKKSNRELQLKHPIPHTQGTETSAVTFPSDCVFPPWSTLPYEILVQIFNFASYPLRDDVYRPTPSVSWLVQASTVCKSFAEPALCALYENPPLLFLDKPHRLLELLESSPNRLAFNYATKTKILDLDLDRTLLYTTTGKGHFDLTTLVKRLPKLAKIDISRSINRPPFRDTRYFRSAAKWHYPESLFKALRRPECRLRSWRFDEDILFSDKRKDDDTREGFFFKELRNPQGGFRSLRHLSLSRFHRLFNPEHQEALKVSLLQLHELESLEFESCVCEDWYILRLLPPNLLHLSFVNCDTLSSRNFKPFLASHGAQVRSLTLNHNRALDLSFLEDFRATCPKLEIFRVDCNYFSALANRLGSDPEYEAILAEDQVPSWPSTLQVIEMLHLRRWTSQTAEVFFGSLIDNASELPNLRILVLKVILDIGWRDRAGFREARIGELRRVFLRCSTPPNRHLSSLKAFRIWNTGRHTERCITADVLANHFREEHPSSESQSNKSPGNTRSRKSQRILRKESERVSSSLHQADAYESTGSAGNSNDNSELQQGRGNSRKARRNPFIQGMCNVVDISIDNLRPREIQFHESDFMDSEASGDEEWTRDVDISPQTRYAW